MHAALVIYNNHLFLCKGLSPDSDYKIGIWAANSQGASNLTFMRVRTNRTSAYQTNNSGRGSSSLPTSAGDQVRKCDINRVGRPVEARPGRRCDGQSEGEYLGIREDEVSHKDLRQSLTSLKHLISETMSELG